MRKKNHFVSYITFLNWVERNWDDFFTVSKSTLKKPLHFREGVKLLNYKYKYTKGRSKRFEVYIFLSFFFKK